jgi:integrase
MQRLGLAPWKRKSTAVGCTAHSSRQTLAQLITRYRNEVTPHKKGREAETRRLNRLLKDPIAAVNPSRLTAGLCAAFRDRRVKNGPRACAYDLTLLKGILRKAKAEWGMQVFGDLLAGIQKPRQGKPRTRRLIGEEMDRLVTGLDGGRSWYLKPLVLLALATGMRRSELLKVLWNDLNPENRTLVIRDTKNGDDRIIPLSTSAMEIIVGLPRTSPFLFPLGEVAVRQSWDRLVRRSRLGDFHFHDLRHEAISRFFERGLRSRQDSVKFQHLSTCRNNAKHAGQRELRTAFVQTDLGEKQVKETGAEKPPGAEFDFSGSTLSNGLEAHMRTLAVVAREASN